MSSLVSTKSLCMPSKPFIILFTYMPFHASNKCTTMNRQTSIQYSVIITPTNFNYFCHVTNNIMCPFTLWYVSFWASMDMCGYLYKNSNISHCAVDDTVKDIKHSSLTHIVISIWQSSLYHIFVRWWSGQYCGGWQVCYIIPCSMLNTLRLTQNDCNFAADILKCNFFLWKIMYSDWNVTEVCSQLAISQHWFR